MRDDACRALRPDLELEESNVIGLSSDWKGYDLHRLLGHVGDWMTHNPHVRADAAAFRRMVQGRQT